MTGSDARRELGPGAQAGPEDGAPAGAAPEVRDEPGTARRERRAASRVVGIDVARCVALLGMMATHILRPVDSDGTLAWPQALAGGRASALFAVLAGVSLALMTGRRDPHRGLRRIGDAGALTGRALVIGLVGLWLGQLDTRVAVILVYYSVLFVLALPFLGLRPRTLFTLAAAWCVLAPPVSHLLRSAWGDQPPTVPTTDSIEALGSTLMDLVLTGYYPAFPWLAYVLVGLGIGRLDLRSTVVDWRLLAAGALTASAAWGLSLALTASASARGALMGSTGATSWADVAHRVSLGLGGTTPTDSWWWLAVVGPHSGTPFDLVHTAGTAMAVIGAALLLSRAAARHRWSAVAWATAFGAGAMTLTLYTLHVALLTPGRWPDPTVANYCRHVLLALGVGAAFALAGRRGPLESVARLASTWSRRLVMGRGGPGHGATP